VLCGRPDAGPARCSNRQRRLESSAGDVGLFRYLVDRLVAGRREEVGELQFDDGPQAADRRPQSVAGNRYLREGRVPDPLLAVLRLEPLCRTEDAPILSDVFPGQIHVLVPP